MIPRTIHYCWFGGNPKSDLVLKCIESWKKYCPDYQIIEWNEHNWDINYNQYTQEAYQAKKWAFVADIARLDIIYRYGGLYLDTDVELRSCPENFISGTGCLIFESLVSINTGLGFAADAENPLIGAMLADYQGRSFYKEDGTMNLTACPYYNTKIIRSLLPSLQMNDQTQHFDLITILSNSTYQQFACHHGAMSWTDTPRDHIIYRQYKDTALKYFLRSPKKFQFIERHFPESILKLYTWTAYDLLEQGPAWLFKKFIYKFFKKGS